MNRSRPSALLALLVVALAVLGGVVGVARLVGEPRALLVLALVAAIVLAAIRIGARSRDWLAGTYW